MMLDKRIKEPQNWFLLLLHKEGSRQLNPTLRQRQLTRVITTRNRKANNFGIRTDKTKKQQNNPNQ